MLYGIGYSTVPVEKGPLFNVRNTMIEAPSNYKDPIKIKEYIDKIKEKRAAESCQTPMMCRLGRVWIQGDGGADPIVSLGQFNSYLELVESLGNDGESLVDRGSTELAVINPSLFANLLMLDHLNFGLKLDKGHSWLFRNRMGDPLFPLDCKQVPFVIFDPVPALTGTAVFCDHPVEVAAEFGFKDDPESSYEKRMALIALHLAKVMGRE